MSGPHAEGPPPPRVTVNVRFRQDDLDRVDAEAVRDRRETRSDMIRVLVLEALEARERRHLGETP